MNTAQLSLPSSAGPVCHSAATAATRCRHCDAALTHTFVDLGLSPPCQNHITTEQLGRPELFYPLHVYVCTRCYLVQLPNHLAAADIFEEYAYFSSYSDTLVAHARRYVEDITALLRLDRNSSVVELASNDGYLLQFFQERGIPALGIEPAKNVAAAALARGLPTRVAFFGRDLAQHLVDEGHRADLLLGNNVLPHVPDINDFVGGMKILLAPAGVITLEFQHLLRLIEHHEFDTIYHEHYSYLTLTSVVTILAHAGLAVFDVEEIPTHGGSLRIYVRHTEDTTHPATSRVRELLEREDRWGVTDPATYARFGEEVRRVKRRLLACLIKLKDAGESIAGYGAPGKATTLLNYCGIRTDLLDYTVDRNPYKQGKFTAGTRVPIFAPHHLRETKPDYVLLLAWNLRDEVMQQAGFIREWGGQFIVPIPEPTIHP